MKSVSQVGHNNEVCLGYNVNRDIFMYASENRLYSVMTNFSINLNKLTMYCTQCDRILDYEDNIGISYCVCCYCMGHKIIGGKK